MTGGDTAFHLNPALDRPALASRLAERGRVQIRDVLTPDSAERIAHCLARQVPWCFTYFDGEDGRIVAPEEVRRVPPATWQALQHRVVAMAQSGFTYAYELYPMLEARREGRDPGLLLHRFLAFLEGPEMMQLIAELLGTDEACRVDAQATRFGPSHFLGYHNDLVPGSGRLCAYVFSFTRLWRPDWGGYLQFFDESGNGREAFMPSFNTLNIFTVPQPHAVTLVAPFAGGHRYAVSGWYMDHSS